MDAPAVPVPSLICPQCHQSVLPTYYFCPNCGKKLNEPALDTGFWKEAWIYVFAAILPIICFLAIGYWPALKYVQSKDPKARQIGIIGIVVLLISTAITFWLSVQWLNGLVQSSINSVGNIGGGLGGGL